MSFIPRRRGAFDEGIGSQSSIDDSSVKLLNGNSRTIMNMGQKTDSEGNTDQVREYIAKNKEKDISEANDKQRKKGKTPVVRIDSNPNRDLLSLEDAEIPDDGSPLPSPKRNRRIPKKHRR